MGNPPIHPVPPAPRIEPPHLRVLWVVYRLRNAGEKLSREDAERTGLVGTLQFLRFHNGMRARLMDPERGHTTLLELENARLAPCERGLLLHGAEHLNIQAGPHLFVMRPQAWWCVVRSAEPCE